MPSPVLVILFLLALIGGLPAVTSGQRWRGIFAVAGLASVVLIILLLLSLAYL